MINKTDSGQFRVFTKRQFQSECKASFHKNVPKAQVVSKTTLECPGGKYVIVVKNESCLIWDIRKKSDPPPPFPKKGTSDIGPVEIFFQRSRQKFEPLECKFQRFRQQKTRVSESVPPLGEGVGSFFLECPIMSYFYLNPVLMRSFSPCDLNSMSGSSGD